MLSESSLSKTESYYALFIVALSLFGFFYNLGIYPFFLEEPRRAIIAYEMVVSNNYWVPTVMGDLYFKKPPVFNWMIVLAYKTFGYNEISLRLITVISHVVISAMLYFFVKWKLGLRTAAFASIGFLLSADILFYFSFLGEIDLFYSLVTTLALFAIIYYGDKDKLWTLFLIVYTLTAIGFLTKGLTSLPFTAIALLVYFIVKKRFKVLLSPPHFTGIILFVILVGSYFWKYSTYAPVENWLTVLYSESADKAVKGSSLDFLKHLMLFPLAILGALLPASISLIAFFKKEKIKAVFQNDFLKISFLFFLLNFLIYWFSVEGRSRYVYPILPFMIIPLAYMIDKKFDESKWLKIITVLITLVSILALPATLFFKELAVVDNLALIVGILAIAILAMSYYAFKRKLSSFLQVLGIFAILKIGSASILPVTRAKTSGAVEDKKLANEIVEITKGEAIYRFGNPEIKLSTAFYIERGKGQILSNKTDLNERFYIISEKDFPIDVDYKVVLKLRYEHDDVYLVEIIK